MTVSGEWCRALSGVIYHDDRKPLSRWFASQQRYARLESDHLLKADAGVLSASDRLRRMAWPAPIVVFFYVLVVWGCLFRRLAGLDRQSPASAGGMHDRAATNRS